MNFTSLLYLPLLFLASALYPRLKSQKRTGFLLASSWSFFFIQSPGSFLILFFVSLISFYAGLKMGCSKESGKGFELPGPRGKPGEMAQDGRRKRWLIFSLLFTLTLLGIFKYSGLFLPAGISFYTFQALAYSIDVYRGDLAPERSFLRYALFLAFFPQLVAGPIERPNDLMVQLCGDRVPSFPDFQIGGYRILRGYMKKIIVADGIAPLVDRLFSGSMTGLSVMKSHAAGPLFTGPQVFAAGLLFALQIYADFSGYTDIAVGSARLFGICLHENFDRPYLARGFRDFWHRWHMTLSRWLNDYLYIPLGGSRKGSLRTVLNTLLVFAASGIWHGRGLHYLVWGLFHGGMVLAERALEGLSHKRVRTLGMPFSLITYLGVSMLWILFRSESLSAAFCMYGALLSGWRQGPLFLRALFLEKGSLAVRAGLAYLLLFLAGQDRTAEGEKAGRGWHVRRGEREEEKKTQEKGKLRSDSGKTTAMRECIRLLSGYGLFLLILYSLFLNFREGAGTPFLYFQF